MLLITALCLIFITNALACVSRSRETGYFCVCNSTYCDAAPSLDTFDELTLKIFYTGNVLPGFNAREATFTQTVDPGVFTITVTTDTYQNILGFGGAFTDAGGINTKKLSEAAQQKLLETYFGDDGIGFSLMRVPIGASDFSTRTYTYDDVDGDRDLSQFALQDEDYSYKIPYIQQAQTLRKGQLKLFATPWTAPIWMKTPAIWNGGSILLKENYQLYADYLVRFFDEYAKNNIQFWGLTTGNEPLTGYFSTTQIPSMGWTADAQGEWLVSNLAPTLKNSAYPDLKIIIFDDGLLPMPFIVPYFLANDTVLQYVDGVGTHTYWDFNMSPRIRNLGRTDKKDLFRLSTEGSHYQTAPILGLWDRADDYINNIFLLLREYEYSGWVEYSLALDTEGGPTYVGDKADAPIIVSDDGQEFFKQPTFYALGHFSKFVVPDSIRLGVQQVNDYVLSVAFLRPDGLKALVLYNYNYEDATVQIEDSGRYSTLTLPANTINTIVYHG